MANWNSEDDDMDEDDKDAAEGAGIGWQER